MKKGLLFVVLSFVFFVNGSEAQWLSNHRNVTDPVRDFLSDFSAAHPQINNSIIVDNDSSWVNSAIGELKYIYADRGYTKVRKTTAYSTTKKNHYTDSITLGRKEIKLILQQLGESKYYTWSGDYFPQDRLVTAAQIGSLYRKDPKAYRKNGAWYFSLPLFLRNGEMLVCYHMYSCGGDCGQDELTVYEKTDGHWQKFGSIFSRKY